MIVDARHHHHRGQQSSTSCAKRSAPTAMGRVLTLIVAGQQAYWKGPSKAANDASHDINRIIVTMRAIRTPTDRGWTHNAGRRQWRRQFVVLRRATGRRAICRYPLPAARHPGGGVVARHRTGGASTGCVGQKLAIRRITDATSRNRPAVGHQSRLAGYGAGDRPGAACTIGVRCSRRPSTSRHEPISRRGVSGRTGSRPSRLAGQ